MLLSDRSIADHMANGDLRIEPWKGERQLQPASIEVHLGFSIDNCGFGAIHPDDYLLTLHPNEFRLAHTLEVVTLPADIAARVEGKSSLGRLGLLIHTAGFIDPGFSGQITLELKNLNHDQSLTLSYGQPVGQLAFFTMTTPAHRPYGHEELGSHYQGQRGTTPSYMS